MAELKLGSKAPAVKLPADDGSRFDLAALKGKRVVLYFYPKADTPGCTTEACDFRDAMPSLAKDDTVVVGVSPDPVKNLAKFKTKYDLNFVLLSDEQHQVAEAYGVWVEKNMYGNKSMGIERSTFLIDAEGRLAKIYRKVKAQGHAAQVREDLKSL